MKKLLAVLLALGLLVLVGCGGAEENEDTTIEITTTTEASTTTETAIAPSENSHLIELLGMEARDIITSKSSFEKMKERYNLVRDVPPPELAPRSSFNAYLVREDGNDISFGFKADMAGEIFLLEHILADAEILLPEFIGIAIMELPFVVSRYNAVSFTLYDETSKIEYGISAFREEEEVEYPVLTAKDSVVMMKIPSPPAEPYDNPYQRYLGRWQGISGQTLTISEISKDAVAFDLLSVRIFYLEEIAKFENGQFVFRSAEYPGLSGTIGFNKDNILITIVESELPFPEAGATFEFAVKGA